MPLLVANERIVLSTTMSVKPTNAVPLPSFLLPSAKRRQLIMTDLPRLLVVKDDTETGEPKVKIEFEFLAHPVPGRTRTAAGDAGGRDKEESSINYILEVQEKGSKVFVLQTVRIACPRYRSSTCTDIRRPKLSLAYLTLPTFGPPGCTPSDGWYNLCCTIPPKHRLHPRRINA